MLLLGFINFDQSLTEDGNELVLLEYVKDVKNRLQAVHDVTRNSLQIASARMKLRSNQKAKPNSFGECAMQYCYFNPTEIKNKKQTKSYPCIEA